MKVSLSPFFDEGSVEEFACDLEQLVSGSVSRELEQLSGVT